MPPCTHTPSTHTHPPSHTCMRVHHSLACTYSVFWEWGWEAVTVSFGMASYQTIRLPSDSLSRWRWDRASEARTPADTESMEASPDLLPDGGALMWARVSLVSPVWLGLRWCQDAGALRPGFRLAAAAPLQSLAPGQGVGMGRELTRVPALFLLWKIGAMYGCIHSHTGTHTQALTYMQLANSRALDISLSNISTATHTDLRARERREENSRRNLVIRHKKAWRSKWVRLVRGTSEHWERERKREREGGGEGGGTRNLGEERIPYTFIIAQSCILDLHEHYVLLWA